MPREHLADHEHVGQAISAKAPPGRSGGTISAKPEQVMARARELHTPIATVCLFSGGNDSSVLAHRCRVHYELLVFIDTGTALPGVREFVGEFATWIGKPLKIVEARGAYRDMVLGTGKRRTRGPNAGVPSPPLGFPGPAQHGRAYIELKERSLERLLRDIKQGHPRTSRVLALSGARRAESARRNGRVPLTRRGSLAFCNPLIDWSDLDVHRYRRTHSLPQSDVAALIHRSGECNCGAFAAPGEREMLKSLWPEWFDRTIASLEREAEDRGVAHCRWGCRPESYRAGSGSLCTDCELRAHVA